MKYLVAGNYTRFAVTLTQKSGELITPYIPTEGDVVQISLYGARRFDYPNYTQAQNVLTFEDNGCLQVGLYCLEIKITEANTHKLRCMYREQIRVVASNDDVPTDASFTDDDVQLSGQFDIVASTEIVVDDELSLTSTNPVQNKVVTAALNTKGDNLESVFNMSAGVELKLKRGDVVLSNAVLPFAGLTQGKGGLMSAYDYSKLAGIEAQANKTIVDDALSTTSENPVQNKVVTAALNTKYDNISVWLNSSGWDITFMANGANAYELYIGGATSTTAGLLLPSEKTKLAGIEAGANKTLFEDAPTQGSTKAVTSGGVYSALAGKQDALTFDNAPTQNSDNPVKSGGVYTALRDKLGKIDDGVYVSTQSGGRIDFYASGTQYVLVLAPIPNATTTDNGLMSASDYSKLAALPTNADLATALNGKQATLTWDTVPTQGSDNPVTSGGLYVVLGDIESILDNINGD